MTESFNLIKKLVEDFKQQESAYLRADYSEQRVREDYINKFFTYLGWDVTHEVQKNPYEQEVKIENPISTGGSQRRADYAFYVAPNFRDVKFFVEAKKPSRNLANADDYYQTIRYGWNQKTPVAILTDFEEFHILDCRYKPDIKTALERKIEVFHYTDYTDEEKFRRIYYLFGRDEVGKGSIEKFSAALPSPKGKAAQKGFLKSGYQPVDEAFLEQLDEYREILAKAFKNKNPGLDGEELTETVQRIIDRLVFIRFLEDKSIEDSSIIHLAKKSSAWKAFLLLCKSFEPKYNGLVFKPHRIIDSPDFHPPDNKPFADICSELADPASPYDFDKIPISILGSIYERFLGKVVNTTDKRAKVVEKPEVRKAGGVYYTPEYIVRYIVNETVGRLIEGKTPEEISQMAFADIACGSGSFLIEVYNLLLEYHSRYYAAHPGKARKGDIEMRDGEAVLSLKKRQQILVNNIYGVDIDFQATEVTQLSLYLKLLEDVTMNDAFQFSLLKEKILPDLKNNIVCGDSLIGTDILEGKLFAGDDERKLNPMNFEDAFPHIFSPLERGRRGVSDIGFDAVVGNPPYGIIGKKEAKNQITDYLHLKYSSFQYKADLYHLFIERAINLLRQNGVLGYITPNTWYSLQFTKNLRGFVLKNSMIQKLLIFNHKVFGDANVDTSITVLRKGAQKENQNIVDVWNFPKDFYLELMLTTESHKFSQMKWQNNEAFRFDTRVSYQLEQLISKIKSQSKLLGTIARASLGTQAYNSSKHTKEQITKRVFHSFNKISDEYLPELSGSDVGRYSLQWQKKEYIKYGPWLHDYRSLEWITGERLLIREITGKGFYKIYATYVEDTYCNYKTILNIIYGVDKTFSLKFLLGVLNSRLISFVYPLVSNKIVKESFPRLSVGDLRLIPIHTLNFSDPSDKSRHDNIVNLVEQMLSAKQKQSAAKTDGEINKLELQIASLDRKIDEAVYELYGLSEEEIRVVDDSTCRVEGK